MFNKSCNPIVERKEINRKEFIHFIFSKILTPQEAESFISEAKQLIAVNQHKKVIIIWECMEMTNDKAEARLIFQNALKELKEHIEAILLMTDSILIQAEAEIISFYTSFKINLVKSEEELLSQMML